jgi:D-proline reductase (dithiol) PrdB
MARIETIPEPERSHLLNKECPTFERTPFVSGPPLSERRVAIISTAGLHPRDDRPFTSREADYRIIPGSASASELVMSHVSTNFDRSGFQRDVNVVFPLDRLKELADAGVIGGVADYHYSFMGAARPEELEGATRRLAGLLKADGVDATLLVPV